MECCCSISPETLLFINPTTGIIRRRKNRGQGRDTGVSATTKRMNYNNYYSSSSKTSTMANPAEILISIVD
jgi:hypothetical protein